MLVNGVLKKNKKYINWQKLQRNKDVLKIDLLG